VLVAGVLLLARLCCARGEREVAIEALVGCEAIAHSSQFLREIRAAQAEIELTQGNLSPVDHWAATYLSHHEDLPYMRQEKEALLFVRLQLARGEAVIALEHLALWKQAAISHGRIRSLLEILILEALAYSQQSDLPQAIATLNEALLLAQPEGFQRLFLDEGAALARLLKSALPELREERLIAYARNLLLAFKAKPEQQEQTGDHHIWLAPLTPQELRVLRLLVSGRSNPEIARELIVSPNTVKTQVRSIYQKLDVRNRQEASDAARHYHLL
jgi:LuxR family maltose regulon positive regulatory protein